MTDCIHLPNGPEKHNARHIDKHHESCGWCHYLRSEARLKHVERLAWRLKAYTASTGMVPTHVPDDLIHALIDTLRSEQAKDE